MINILYLAYGAGTVLSNDCEKNMFFHLSRYFKGHVIFVFQNYYFRSEKDLQNKLDSCGNFKGIPLYIRAKTKLLRPLVLFCQYVYSGLSVYYSGSRFEAVVCYGTYTTALAGSFIKLITGAKLIVRVPGTPGRDYLDLSCGEIKYTQRIKNELGKFVTFIVLNYADHIQLLYPNQLVNIILINKKKISIFFDFTPISSISPKKPEKYIFSMGYPWHHKGFDVIIKAFNLISREIEDYKLKLLAIFQDKLYLKELIGTNDRIEISRPLKYKEAIDVLSSCSLFVLASRREGMGRVLLEAMAAKKPIIASNVDGIPHYIKDGVNGLLFESEDVQDLADKMRYVIKNPDYASKISKKGYDYVHEYLSEERFAFYFKEMVEKTLKNSM